MNKEGIVWDNILSYENVYMACLVLFKEDGEKVKDTKVLEAEYNQVFTILDNMRERVNVHWFVDLIHKWDSLSDLEQIDKACKINGVYNASYFIAFMDCLALKKKRGTLNL